MPVGVADRDSDVSIREGRAAPDPGRACARRVLWWALDSTLVAHAVYDIARRPPVGMGEARPGNPLVEGFRAERAIAPDGRRSACRRP